MATLYNSRLRNKNKKENSTEVLLEIEEKKLLHCTTGNQEERGKEERVERRIERRKEEV